jgi:type VI secretion system protein ImpE
MSAEEALHAGRLDEALSQLQLQVRADPADAKSRVFLFQLLCVQGEWNRALTQLNVAGDLDASTLLMVQTYREALRCEVYRGAVFAGQQTPMVLGKPDPWLALLLKSLSLTATARHEEAATLRTQAFEDAPATSGRIDGVAFDWLADADSRLGPCLEVIVNGRYYWVPFHRIREIRIDPPADLRDFVWVPVQLTWSNGGQAVGLVPARYPGTELADDPALRLCRRTDWQESEGAMLRGMGQRMFATDAGDYSLLDLRHIELASVPEPAVSSGGDA